MRTVAFVAASVLVVSLIPLLVVAVLPRDERRLRRVVAALVSFAIGALLGGAMLHLIPEAQVRLGAGRRTGLAVLAGFLGFFLLERFLWLHGHAAPQARHTPLPPLAALNVLGDGLHNLMDGMAIAASYLADPRLGATTTLAVVLHEVPQELGDYGVLLSTGMPVRRAVRYNLASAAAAFFGAGAVLLLGIRAGRATDLLLAVAAGNFLYIAASDLVPELQRERSPRATAWQVVTILLGIAVMLLPDLVG